MTIQEWLTKTHYPSYSGVIRSEKVHCKERSVRLEQTNKEEN